MAKCSAFLASSANFCISWSLRSWTFSDPPTQFNDNVIFEWSLTFFQLQLARPFWPLRPIFASLDLYVFPLFPISLCWTCQIVQHGLGLFVPWFWSRPALILLYLSAFLRRPFWIRRLHFSFYSLQLAYLKLLIEVNKKIRAKYMHIALLFHDMYTNTNFNLNIHIIIHNLNSATFKTSLVSLVNGDLLGF